MRLATAIACHQLDHLVILAETTESNDEAQEWAAQELHCNVIVLGHWESVMEKWRMLGEEVMITIRTYCLVLMHQWV